MTKYAVSAQEVCVTMLPARPTQRWVCSQVFAMRERYEVANCVRFYAAMFAAEYKMTTAKATAIIRAVMKECNVYPNMRKDYSVAKDTILACTYTDSDAVSYRLYLTAALAEKDMCVEFESKQAYVWVPFFCVGGTEEGEQRMQVLYRQLMARRNRSL